jgi:hypothetical protein
MISIMTVRTAGEAVKWAEFAGLLSGESPSTLYPSKDSWELCPVLALAVSFITARMRKGIKSLVEQDGEQKGVPK